MTERGASVKIKLCVEAWEHTPHIHAEELVRRLLCRFPEMIVDKEKGNAHVQERLEQLMKMGAPNIILESHMSYVGNVIFVSISDCGWSGATVTSYLYSIWPPLGDTVFFDVTDAIEATTVDLITQELKSALNMVLCSEIPATKTS